MLRTTKTLLLLSGYTIKTWLLLIVAVFLGSLGAISVYFIISLLSKSLFFSFLAAGSIWILMTGGCLWLSAAKRIISIGQVILTGTIFLILIVTITSFFAVAKLTDSISLLILVATLTLSMCMGGSWMIIRDKFRKPRFLPLIVMVETLLLLGLLANQLVFKPFDLPKPPQFPPSAVRFWQLSTGSRIAYTYIPAVNTPRPTPVVFLHGGPGGLITKTQHQVFRRLAENGFDVYLYDQVGGGFSERLTNIVQYTVARLVTDLEAIRQQLNVEQIILIGHSWGGELAAHYLAKYPNRVAKVIFSSPFAMRRSAITKMGHITDRLSPEQETKAERFLLRYYLSPRFITQMTLLWLNPEAAHNFAGDREMDSLDEALFELILPGAFCNRAIQTTNDSDAAHGGYYASTQLSNDVNRVEDIRPILSKNQTPALILRGECDYFTWEHANQYKQTLSNSTLLYIEDAGHSAYTEKPELYLAAVRAFLLEQALPLKPYTKSN